MSTEQVREDDALLTRSLGLHAKAIRESSRECDFVASTASIDLTGEVLTQDWDLSVFKANPIVLYAHDRWDLPIGQATACEVRDGQLECTIKFASADANPKAEQVWKLVQEKVLRAVSVGFRSKDCRYEMRDGKDVWILSGNRLFEVSVTPIPCNPEALAKQKALAVERSAREGATPKGAESATEDTTMDVKEIESLREKAVNAEKAQAVAESKLAESVKALDTAKTEIDGLKTDVAAKTKAIESVTKERDSAVADLAVAKKTITEAKVDALVGKKFAPSERDVMLELALTNDSLFAKTIDARPDMTHTTQVVPSSTKAAPSAGSDNGDALAALIEKSA